MTHTFDKRQFLHEALTGQAAAFYKALRSAIAASNL